MKAYPSITRSTGQSFEEFDAYVFDKLDGRNVRVEWSKKQGWHKFGTRHRLFDKTDKSFANAIPLFQETLSEKLTKVARDARWERVIAFMEFWGPTTLGGLMNPDESYDATMLSVIDLAPYKKGLLDPREFQDIVTHHDIPAPQFLGSWRWTRGFVEQVRIAFDGDGEFASRYGITHEGVVGKRRDGAITTMAKAKTQKWIDAIIAQRGEIEGRKLVES